MQPYLKPNDFTSTFSKFHFAARSSMINIRGNFKNQFGPEGNYCQGCLDKNEPESQMHIFQCISLGSSEIIGNNPPNYDDLFFDDVGKQVAVSKILKKRIEVREKLINSRQKATNQI